MRSVCQLQTTAYQDIPETHTANGVLQGVHCPHAYMLYVLHKTQYRNSQAYQIGTYQDLLGSTLGLLFNQSIHISDCLMLIKLKVHMNSQISRGSITVKQGFLATQVIKPY